MQLAHPRFVRPGQGAEGEVRPLNSRVSGEEGIEPGHGHVVAPHGAPGHAPPLAHGGVHDSGQEVLQQPVGWGGIGLAFQLRRKASPGRGWHGSQQLGQPAGVLRPVEDGTPVGLETLGSHLLDGRDVALGGQQLQGKAGYGAPKGQVVSQDQMRGQLLWRRQRGEQMQGLGSAQAQALQLEATQARWRCLGQLIPVVDQARGRERQIPGRRQQGDEACRGRLVGKRRQGRQSLMHYLQGSGEGVRKDSGLASPGPTRLVFGSLGPQQEAAGLYRLGG